MLTVILTIVFAILIAFFATQNTTSVIVSIQQYSTSVPIYLIVLISLLVGFVFAWILHLLNSFASLFTLMGKNNDIKKEKKTNVELKKKVRALETEKDKLETEKKFRPSV